MHNVERDSRNQELATAEDVWSRLGGGRRTWPTETAKAAGTRIRDGNPLLNPK